MDFDELSLALSYAALFSAAPAAVATSAPAASNEKKAEKGKKDEKPKKDAGKKEDFDDMFADEPAEPAAKSFEPKKEDVVDVDDMFGDDGDETAEEAAATKARRERMETARKLKEEKDAKDGKTKKEKVKAVEKSLVVLEVKPWEADTDLKAVWELIRKHEQEGLAWGESYKLEPVAYGIMKLVMTCTIVDSLVLMDDVTGFIESLEDHVQSVEVASMNKIS